MKALGTVSRINVICSLSGGTNWGRRNVQMFTGRNMFIKGFSLGG